MHSTAMGVKAYRIVVCSQPTLGACDPLSLIAVTVAVIHTAIPVPFIVDEITGINLIWQQIGFSAGQSGMLGLCQFFERVQEYNQKPTSWIVPNAMSFSASLYPLTVILQPTSKLFQSYGRSFTEVGQWLRNNYL